VNVLPKEDTSVIDIYVLIHNSVIKPEAVLFLRVFTTTNISSSETGEFEIFEILQGE
jgi:hypothetical protein